MFLIEILTFCLFECRRDFGKFSVWFADIIIGWFSQNNVLENIISTCIKDIFLEVINKLNEL